MARNNLGGCLRRPCVAMEAYSDSDTESTVSFGAEADRQLEAPIGGVHSVLHRVVRF